MKTAIYTEDKITQLIITPENDFEKEAIEKFADQELAAKIFVGSFYDSRGGWVRQSRYFDGPYGESEDKSLIIRLNEN